MLDSLTAFVRPIVTLALIITLCAGFFMGKISADQFIPIVAMAVAFWFGERKAERG